MTTDETPRDPLAVALHDEWDRRTGKPSEPGVPCPDCIESAGRIRAALASPTRDAALDVERARRCITQASIYLANADLSAAHEELAVALDALAARGQQ